jgi:hypothetical protein
MPAVWLLEGGHRERNSASETAYQAWSQHLLALTLSVTWKPGG